jgi:dolichyl-phosphate-mannose--protein O-mannosyl transferase
VNLLQRLNRPVVAIVAVALLAGGLRLWHLSDPPDLVFDELYYAKAGCVLTGGTDQECRVESSDEHYWVEHKWDMGSWVHPPLGKWMTAMGIKAFGMDPFGWRVPSAISGTLVAVMVALMAQLLFARPVWTFLAGTFIALDGLNLVMSRVAMLDVHLEFWVTLGFLCLVLDRRWIERRTSPVVDPAPAPATYLADPQEPADRSDPSDTSATASGVAVVEAPTRRRMRVPSPLWRPWRFAAGVALGAACAVKWSGAFALVAAVVLAVMWETTRRHRDDVSWPRAFARTAGMETLGLVLAFVLVPAGVYMLTWLPWFHHFGWSLPAWWEDQRAMWDYQRHLTEFAYDSKTKTFTPTHSSYSDAWTWILMKRPVNFYVQDLGADVRQILTIGNLALFWGTVFTLPYTLWAWRRKRDWRAGFMATAFVLQWLPWFQVARPEFFFYILPMTPFMALMAVYALRDLSEARLVLRDAETGDVAIDPETGGPAVSTRHPYRPFVYGYIAIFLALFVWFWPLLVGLRISDALWRVHIWLPTWN